MLLNSKMNCAGSWN